MASVLAVLALWVLLDPILGLITLRADTGLTLTQALLLGAAINIIPDYLSLYEPRWLLKLFDRFRNSFVHAGLLVIDALVTGLIIFASIQAYLWITGSPPISIIEMMALFSIYSVFFYSTFLTSAWAWAYCLSSWPARLSARLSGWLAIDTAPGRIFALLVAGVTLLGSAALKPVLTTDENGRTAFDEALCETFPRQACLHVARLTPEQQVKMNLLERACHGRGAEECYAFANIQFKSAPNEVFHLFSVSCFGGNARGCTNLGMMHARGLGTKKVDYVSAIEFYAQGCNGGNGLGCVNLGVMYETGRGAGKNFAKAAELYQHACDLQYARGCTFLGFMYEDKKIGLSATPSASLYDLGCQLGDSLGCEALLRLKLE